MNITSLGRLFSSRSSSQAAPSLGSALTKTSEPQESYGGATSVAPSAVPPKVSKGGGWARVARTGLVAGGLVTASLVGPMAVNLIHPLSAAAPIAYQQMTPMQKHLAFFDQDHNGQLTIQETYQGLRELHLNPLKAAAVATFINVGIGISASDHLYDVTTVDLNKVHLAKHGSDTGIFDAKGQFVPEKFTALFQRFDTNKDGSLSDSEITAMHAQLNNDKAGAVASKGEFALLMGIAGENRQVDGHSERVLTRETMQSFYDGTLFYKLAGQKPPF